MPRAFDRQQLVIDRNPLQGLVQDYGKLPKLDDVDPAGVIGLWVGWIKDVTGIDLSGVVDFMNWLSDQVGLVMAGFGATWQNLLNGIATVWQPIQEGINAVVNDVITAISGIFNTGRNAALAADNANIAVERLRAELAGGGFDEFDYASANALPSGIYELSSGGPGAGNYGPDGNGFLVWKPSGSLTREIIYRRLGDTLGVDDGVVTVVWSTKPNNALFPKTFGYICGRMSNTSNNTHVRAKISDNSALIEAVVSGTPTQIGSTRTGMTIRNGDVFEFYFGHPDHPRRFWLRQNGVTVLTVNDGSADGSGAISQRGSAYRSVGFGCIVEPFLLIFQNPAPSLAGWTWAPQDIGGS
jgi:hypothetical protein